jgi:hypothetical protein
MQQFSIAMLVLGSMSILVFYAWSLKASMGKPIRYAPTTEAVAGIMLDRQVTPVEMKQACINIVLTLNTFSYFSIDQSVKDILPFVDPAEHKRIQEEYAALKPSYVKNWQHRAAFSMGYGYNGQDHGIHRAVVFYRYVEMTGRFGRHAEVHNETDKAVIMDFYLGTPTDENPVGLYLMRQQRFDRDEWMARPGAKDVWSQLRKQKEEPTP